jgi:phosphatidylglycerophosphate synthase
MFALGSKGWLIAGAILLQAGYTLDCCDGELARLKGMQSPWGAALDAVLDALGQFLYILGATWGVYHKSPDIRVFLIGSADIGLLMIYYYFVDAWLGRHTGKETNKFLLIGQSMYLSLKNFVIFGFTLFALLNRMKLFLILLLFASLAGLTIQLGRYYFRCRTP